MFLPKMDAKQATFFAIRPIVLPAPKGVTQPKPKGDWYAGPQKKSYIVPPVSLLPLSSLEH
jgi:hypothetical protein